MHSLKEHATSDDDGDSGEHTEGAVDILVIANEVSKHKEAAMINQSARIKRKNEDTGDGATERPQEEYRVQDAEPIAEYSTGRGKPRSEHADSDCKDDDSDDEEVEPTNKDRLSERDQKCAAEKWPDNVLARQQKNQSHSDEHCYEDDRVQNCLRCTPAKSEILWWHYQTSVSERMVTRGLPRSMNSMADRGAYAAPIGKGIPPSDRRCGPM